MELRLLKYFVTVAEELHFGRAAEKLHIAQPALSIQIKNLEENLGGKLFHRDKRNVKLTEAGKLFLVEARITLMHAKKATNVAKLALSGEVGWLDIGYSDNAAYSGILARLVNKIKQRQPNVVVRLHEMDPLSQVQAVKNGELNAGMINTLSIWIPHEIDIKKLAEWPLCVVLSKDHPLANKAVIKREDLVNEHFIIYSGHKEQQATVAQLVLGYYPYVAHKTNNAMMVMAVVGAGQGVALLPKLFENLLPSSNTVFKPLAGKQISMDCSAVYTKGDNEPLMQLLLDSLD